jgi:hypothetical protein
MIHIVKESEFKNLKRDPLLDFAIYSDEADDLSRRIPNAQKKLSDPDWLAGKDEATLQRLTQGCCDYSIDLVTLSYSAGADIGELRDFFPHIVDYFEECVLYTEAFNRTSEGSKIASPVIHLRDVEFQIANRLLCFAILLGHTTLVPRIMAVLDYNNPVRDGLLERLASVYVQRPQPLPAECTRHLPYYKALSIFDAKSEERPGLIKDYLLDWYEASRREPYYESHTRRSSFLGYWAWEAAAITIALGIDDNMYRDLQFYPRDMVDHGRKSAQAKSSEALDAGTTEIRAKGGEPCPVSGRWQSIGVPVKELNVGLGEPTQNLGSPYGLTVWRLVR